MYGRRTLYMVTELCLWSPNCTYDRRTIHMVAELSRHIKVLAPPGLRALCRALSYSPNALVALW